MGKEGDDNEAKSRPRKSAKVRRALQTRKRLAAENGIIPKAEIVVVKKSERNYSVELMHYVSAWQNQDQGSEWKFNKVLQNWAIENVYNKTVIGKDLFNPLLVYLASVQGAAKVRLLSKANSIVSNAGKDDLADAHALKRALVVIKKVGDSNEE